MFSCDYIHLKMNTCLHTCTLAYVCMGMCVCVHTMCVNVFVCITCMCDDAGGFSGTETDTLRETRCGQTRRIYLQECEDNICEEYFSGS